jgi:hypothetical protein
MKTFIAVLIIGFTVTAIVAQDSDGSACPKITLTVPGGITAPGEEATFLAEILGTVPTNVKYIWTSTNGKVVSGQGTPLIKIRIAKTFRGQMLATVSVLGLPVNCSSRVSEEYGYAIDPGPSRLDEYGSISLKAEMAKLKRAAAKKQPYDQLCLIIYPSETEKETEVRVQRLKVYVAIVLRLERQLTVVVGPNSPNGKAILYIVPPGVNNPQP